MSACTCEPILAFNYGHFENGRGFGLKVNRTMTAEAARHEPDSVLVDEVGYSYCTEAVALKYARTRADRQHSDCLACVYRLSAAAANAAFDKWNDLFCGNTYFDGRCIKESGKEADRLIMFDGLTMTAHTIGMAKAYSKGWKAAEEAFEYKPLTACACGQPRLAQPGDLIAEGTDWTGFPIMSKEPVEIDKLRAFEKYSSGGRIFYYNSAFWTMGPEEAYIRWWFIYQDDEGKVVEKLQLWDATVFL